MTMNHPEWEEEEEEEEVDLEAAGIAQAARMDISRTAQENFS